MIGVFDSGVGGLTVLRELRRRMPEVDFVYVGDVARAPYGRKPARAVLGFACQIADFLCGRGADAIVVACSTATAAALPELRRRCAVPVWGVIDAGVEAATRATRSGNVGVIGTRGTIASGAYQRRLEARGLKVWARACPGLVDLAEKGLAESAEAEALARQYLGRRLEIDTLILGCTHFPLLGGAFNAPWETEYAWWTAQREWRRRCAPCWEGGAADAARWSTTSHGANSAWGRRIPSTIRRNEPY